MPTGTEHAEVQPRQGTACVAGKAGIPDVQGGADDVEERPRREAARRVDRERRALMENKLFKEH